jgi:outer membrane lipoprotein-sorting protein
MGTLCSCSDSSRLDSASVEGDSVTVWLRGTDTGIETITAGYTLSDSLPFLYATTDANGNTITYRLGTVTVEGEADHGIFELCIPEGYAVARP